MVGEVRTQIENLVRTVGRTFLSIKFPRDVEMYFCSLELTSSTGELIDFLSFPIMPESIIKKEPYLSTVKKTFGGLTVLKNSDFIPQEITLRGNFGRGLKLIKGAELVTFFGTSKFGDTKDYKKSILSNSIKTGYGVSKYLQGLIERSRIISSGDNRIPRTLYFHNYTFGESYMVEPTQVQFEQNMGTNMIWTYTLNFKILEKVDYGMLKLKRKSTGLEGVALTSIMSSIGTAGVKAIAKSITRT